MKIKTAELIGAALDWAVAKCEGRIHNIEVKDHIYNGCVTFREAVEYRPSTNPAQAWPIIEREGIRVGPDEYTEHAVKAFDNKVKSWKATCYWITPEGNGPTSLVAAMRCYVASKLGDEAKVPDELLTKGE